MIRNSDRIKMPKPFSILTKILLDLLFLRFFDPEEPCVFLTSSIKLPFHLFFSANRRGRNKQTGAIARPLIDRNFSAKEEQIIQLSPLLQQALPLQAPQSQQRVPLQQPPQPRVPHPPRLPQVPLPHRQQPLSPPRGAVLL